MKQKRDYTRMISYGIVLAFLISLIPIIMVSRYVYPQADDFGFGLRTHLAWESTHSLISVIGAAFDTSIFYWGDWQGTYTSSFLMSLQPGIFGEGYYHIVPMILIGLISLGTFLLVKAILHDVMKAPWYLTLGITGLILLATIQNVKDQTESFTWFNGGIHYTGSHALWLTYMAVLVLAIRKAFDDSGDLSSKSRNWKGLLGIQIAAVLMGFIVGGGNNITVLWAVLANVSIMLAIVILAIAKKKGSEISIGDPIRVLKLMLPSSVALFGGSALNLMSVGNQHRLNFIGGSHNGIIVTILKSFETGAYYSFKWFDGAVVLFVLWMIPLAIRLIKTIEERCFVSFGDSSNCGNNQNGKIEDGSVNLRNGCFSGKAFSFRLPELLLAYSYCLVSALFAPNLYTNGEADVRRTQNGVFYVYIILLALNVIYFTGWAYCRWKKRKNSNAICHFEINAKTGKRSETIANIEAKENCDTARESSEAKESSEVKESIEARASSEAKESSEAMREARRSFGEETISFIYSHRLASFSLTLALTAGVCLFMLLHNPVCFTSSSAAVTCINGNGRAYADIVEYNFDQLNDDSQSDVLVKQITVQPSILYSDEIDWWKAGTVSYYGKNSVEYEE